MPTANETFASRKPGGTSSLSDELARQQAQLAAMTAAQRVDQFGYSSFAAGQYVMAYDALGQARMRIGTQSDGSFAVLYANGDPPPKPSVPQAVPRQLAVGVYWDGTFADGKPRPGDVARVDIHMSTTVGFTPDGTTACGSLTTEGVELLVADNTTHYIKLVAVTSSDVISTPSDEVAVLPLAAHEIAAQAIGAEQLAASIALFSQLIVGQADAGRLEIEGRDGAQQGLRMFSPGGEEMVTFDSLTGNATIRGTLRTADDGVRIVIPSVPDGASTSSVQFYPTTGSNYANILSAPDTRGAIELDSGTDATGSYTSFSLFSNGMVGAYRDHDGNASSSMQLTSTYAQLGYSTKDGLVSQSGALLFQSTGLIRFGLYPTATSTSATQYLGILGSGTTNNDIYLASSTACSLWFSDKPSSSNSTPGIICVDSNSLSSAQMLGASAFTTFTSELAHKENVTGLPFDSLEVIANAPVSEWQYRPEFTSEESLGQRRIGPMVDDLPDQLVFDGPGDVGRGISVTDQIGVMWDAIAKLHARLGDIEAADQRATS